MFTGAVINNLIPISTSSTTNLHVLDCVCALIVSLSSAQYLTETFVLSQPTHFAPNKEAR
jgi:hypothetical protein